MLHSEPKTNPQQTVIAIFRTHEEAEQAVRLLRIAAVPVQSLSIVNSDAAGDHSDAGRPVSERLRSMPQSMAEPPATALSTTQQTLVKGLRLPPDAGVNRELGLR